MSIIAIVISLVYWFWLKEGWWQLGLAVGNSIFLAGLLWKRKGIKKDRYLAGLWLMSLGLGWFQPFRNYEVVKLLSIVTIMALNGYLAGVSRQPKLILDVNRLWRSGWKVIPQFFVEIWNITKITEMIKIKQIGDSEKIKKIISGVALAVPLILIFGTLFYTADPIFAGLVDLIKLPKLAISEKVIFDISSSIICFGIVSTLANFKLAEKSREGQGIKMVDELNLAVALVAGLFLIFVAIQVRYFLASTEDLQKIGIVFSDYTRRGYGQMLLASIMAMGLIYVMDRIKKGKASRTLGIILAAESVLIVMAATKRNYLYQALFGFTRIRLLGFCLSAGMLLILGLILVKLIKKYKDNWFFRRAIMATVAMVLLTNWLNIDQTIVRYKPANLGYDTDYEYMTWLSADAYMAWPKLIDKIEEKTNQMTANSKFDDFYRVRALNEIMSQKIEWLKTSEANNWHNWAGWNLNEQKGYEILRQNEGRLEAIRKQQEIIYPKMLNQFSNQGDGE